MSEFIKIGFLLATAYNLGGCQHPEDLRWSGTPKYLHLVDLNKVISDTDLHGKDWLKPSVTVYSHASPPKTTSNLTVKDLSDHGQAAFIQALAESGSKSDDIRAILAKPSASSSTLTLTPKKVENHFDRTLVATVTKGLDAEPGDRLMWTWILIRPDNFKFASYTVLATNNETLNIEHVQNQTSTSIQGQASATLPSPAKPSVGITASYGNQYTTSADINQQYVKNSVDIFPNFLRIYRESERNLDVAGNTLINLTVLADPKDESRVLLASNPVLSKNGKPLTPSAAKVDYELLVIPPPDDLTAHVSLVYQFRKITCGSESYVEGKQSVRIEQNATPWEPVKIVLADEVRPRKWKIGACQGKQSTNPTPIEAITPNAEQVDLVFDDYETARNMARWMKATQAHSIGKNGQLLKFELNNNTYSSLIAFPEDMHCSNH